MLIDTHIHLDLKNFEKDLDLVIKNAIDNNVSKFIIPAIESNKMSKIIEIVDNFENIYFAAGNHPNRLDSFDIELIKKYAKHEKCVAIGECGLDWYRIPNGSNIEDIKNKQKEIFRKQIELSIEVNKPLILHSRDTDDDMIETLKPYFGKVRGVVHCFVGSKKLLELTNHGFYLGIGGVSTYKNNEIINVLMDIPLDKIVLETDGPYLTPIPFRGKRNEPKYIKNIFNNLEELINNKNLEKIIFQNTEELFFKK